LAVSFGIYQTRPKRRPDERTPDFCAAKVSSNVIAVAISRVLVLGSGYAGSAAARCARASGLDVLVTVRSDARAEALRADGFRVLQAPGLDAGVVAHIDGATHVVVAFQPDPETDAIVARALRGAHSSAYVSSTGVYGNLTGHIDDTTPLPEFPDARAQKILSAEAQYRSAGSTILRCPGIYGPDRGLHLRVLRGEHRIPGKGEGFLSRIHIDDLARFALAAADAASSTFVVGDSEPARHIDVVRFICDAYGVPLPESVPEGSVHASLRADRRIDATRASTLLGVELGYPTYREGMAPAVTGIPPRHLAPVF
jgi:nucleoside-diphosphate-sugar epimerase